MSLPPLRALVVDDEPLATRVLARLINGHGDVMLAGIAADGLDALAFAAEQPVDVIIADIAMPRLAGLELAERLLGERQPAMVFVTAYAEYAVRAFEVGVIDYLLKPVSPERFDLAVQRVRSALVTQSAAPAASLIRGLREAGASDRQVDYLWVHKLGGRDRIALADVELIRAEGDYVRVYTATSDNLADGPLDRIAAMLSPAGFLRVHRSAVVRLDAVSGLRTDASRRLVLTTRSGREIRSGRRASPVIREALLSP